MKPFIGIKKLWYCDPLKEVPVPAKLKTLLSSATQVQNVHDGTWGYSMDDPSTTDYKNELNGQVYYRDVTDKGAKTITFTLGVYSWKAKADLQGGEMVDATGAAVTEESKAVGWHSSDTLENINKCIIAQTKTGNYIVFTNASIVGKVDTQEKNLGLGISAVAMESETDGVEGEYLWDGDAVDKATG